MIVVKDEIHLIDYRILKSLKPNIYIEFIAKFQINDCFENFTHICSFSHYFDRSTSYSYYIKT